MIELPSIERTKSGSNKYLIPVVLLVIFGGAGYYFFTNFRSLLPSSTQRTAATGTEAEYTDFAERVTIAINNINFANQSQQRQDVAGLLSDDLVTSYQNYFYAPDFQRLIADRRIYVTFQKIQRTTVDSMGTDSANVRVTGFNTYRSDVSNTQKEVPFTLLLWIQKKADGSFVCGKIKKL